MEIIFSLQELQKAAARFLEVLADRKVILFHGEMGAGKTTFIHAICLEMGIKSGVNSPTFSIINEYVLPDKESVYHMDLYRLQNEEEAIQVGVEECLLSGNLCLVEWPDKAAGLFDHKSLHCHLDQIGDNERKLQINL